MLDPVDIANPNFAAVLLAGGRSTRMGRDKATLVIDGRTLWERQLAILRALGPREHFISGRRDGPYACAGLEIVEDAIPDLGPLGGIASVLRRVESPLVVVLAIDLPAMTSEFLASLLNGGLPVVPQHGHRFEPLAAVYPKSALPIAEAALRDGDRSMQNFVSRLIVAGLVRAWAVAAGDVPLFQNVNEPGDLKAI